MEKEYVFLQSGESPDFGVFTEGDIRALPEPVGKILCERGVVREVI